MDAKFELSAIARHESTASAPEIDYEFSMRFVMRAMRLRLQVYASGRAVDGRPPRETARVLLCPPLFLWSYRVHCFCANCWIEQNYKKIQQFPADL